MKSPSEVFMFTPTGKEKYIGLDYARGIHTTQWFANATETETIDGHVITTTSQRNHWFSAPDWSDANCDEDNRHWLNDKGKLVTCVDMEAPVRTVSEGTYLNHSTGLTTSFHDHYEYISFLPGTPPADMFNPKAFMKDKPCVPVAMEHVKKMPQLPSAYITILEINRVNTLETINVRQYFDFDEQRVRVDVYDSAGVTSVIHDMQNKLKFTLIDPDVTDDPELDTPFDDKCTKEGEDLWSSKLSRHSFQDADMLQSSYGQLSMHLKDPRQPFMFTTGGLAPPVYVGKDYARGIHCTQWYANATENMIIDDHLITLTTQRNEWFSTPDWSDAGCAEGKDCNLQVPVRAVEEGTFYNHTTKKTTDFHDHYEFVSFLPGHPPAYLFEPETDGLQCPFVPEPAQQDELELPETEEDYSNLAARTDLNPGLEVYPLFVPGRERINYPLPKLSDYSKKHKLERRSDYNSSRGMPRAFEQYTVYMEINKVESGETINVREYFDFNGQRVRTDLRDGNKMTSTIRDFNTNWMYVLVDDDLNDNPTLSFDANQFKCTRQPLNQAMSSFAGRTRHMKSPSEVFMFTPTGKEKYIGLDYARGIHTTQWYAAVEETNIISGHAITTKSTRNHWFSAPDWSDANCDKDGETYGGYLDCEFLEAPVRTVAEGTVFNHTSGKTTKFHDHYEYISFMPGKPPRDLFDPQSEGHKCKTVHAAVLGGSQPWQRAGVMPVRKSDQHHHTISASGGPGGNGEWSASKKFGVFVLIGLVAGVVGVAFLKVRKRRAESSLSWGVSSRSGGLTPSGIAMGNTEPYDRTGSREGILADAI